MVLMLRSKLNPSPFISDINRFSESFAKLPLEILAHLFGYLLPVNTGSDLVSIGRYAIAVRKPSLFSQLKMHPFVVVDAVMRGQEDVVMNILRANPFYLLQSATVKNSVGVEYTVTPLQAAIITNDIPMIEKMLEHFASMDNSDVIMQGQFLQIYKESLRVYYENEAAKVAYLTALKATGTSIDELALTSTAEHCDLYLTALRNGNLIDIFNAHTLAQKNQVFDFQPYIDAVINASETELDEVMALINATAPEATIAAIARGVSHTQIGFTQEGRQYTAAEVQAMPLSELTLIQKLNRFREKIVERMQQEIIFNPGHILAGLKINETAWLDFCENRFPDPGHKKLSVIFSNLVGYAQRKAAEPVKQDIRKGTFYITSKTGEKESCFRPSGFNSWSSVSAKIVHNSHIDVSLVNESALDGLGYKFGGGPYGGSTAPLGQAGPFFSFFKIYLDQKQRDFLKIIKFVAQTPSARDASRCVVQ
jgi:hypothetical protein